MTQTIIKIPAQSSFDPTDIEITDNTSGAFLVKEGSNEYIRIDTTNGAEKIASRGEFFEKKVDILKNIPRRF